MSNFSDFISSGGGSFTAETLSGGLTIASGTSADVTITCPAGKRLKLVRFQSSSSFQDGVSLAVGSKTLFSSERLDDGGNNGTIVDRFGVGLAGGGSTRIGQYATSILGGVDEDIVFSFDSSTSQTLTYSYEVGV